MGRVVRHRHRGGGIRLALRPRSFAFAIVLLLGGASLLASLPGAAVCVPGAPNPAKAKVSGNGQGVWVKDLAASVNQTYLQVDSGRTGVGASKVERTLLETSGPVKAKFGNGTSAGLITSSPAQATHTTIVEISGVDILNGLVTARQARAAAITLASGSTASATRAGSTVDALTVQGVGVLALVPNTRIPLPAATFGAASYVMVNEQFTSITRPAATQLANGTYKAREVSTAIHVHITDLHPTTSGAQSLDIMIARAEANAEFPQTKICTAVPARSADASAYVARGATLASTGIEPFVTGSATVPATGGFDHLHLDSRSAAGSSATWNMDSGETEALGALGSDSVRSQSFAELHGLCLTPSGGGCTVSAAGVRLTAYARVEKSPASSIATGTASFEALTIGTVDVCALLGQTPCQPAPNTAISLPGVGLVVINEQLRDATTATHAGITVRALHILPTASGAPTGAVDLVFGQARAGATVV
ncbi:MAG TPA: choice-of-anchor P family protein [Candidatus Thermoplasmatota archaeon]|jgi:hypothetical protein|nr:choice-of-anchor P family protein [Candidatus Thermoplasmatota archaeon]